MNGSGRGFRGSDRLVPAVLVTLALSVISGPFAVCQQSTAASSYPISEARSAVLAFTDVTVIDVTDGRRVSGQTVVIAGHRMQAVGPSGKVRVPAGARVVDARGKYLLPGLWDMHTHLKTPGSPPPAAHELPLYSNFIAHGVTGIRELGQRISGGTDSFRVWQREIAAGAQIGPRMIGPSIDLTHGMENRVAIPTLDDVPRVIDSLKAVGMAFVKYHDDMGNPKLYFALLREARRVGLPLVGHVPNGVTEVEAADSGQHSIEHINEHKGCWPVLTQGSDSVAIAAVCGQAAAAYIRNRTWQVPTLVWGYYMARQPWGLNAPFRAAQDFVRIMRRRGVTKFLTGSDTGPMNRRQYGIWPGVSLLQELVFLVEAGLTPLEALQAATLNPAKFLGATDSLGSVAPGKLADLVLLDADPLADIYNVMKIRAVVANGRYFNRAALDALDPAGIKQVRDFVEHQSQPANATRPLGLP